MPHRIHAGHHREEDLRGADVGGRLLAPDVLLAGLQRQPVCGVAGGVDRDADEAARHLPLEAGPDRHVAGVRAAEAHRDAEPLAAPDGDVRAPLPRRRDEGEGQEVGGRGDEGTVLVGGRGQRAEVAQLAVGAGVLDDDAEDVTTTGRRTERVDAVDVGEVGDRHLDAQRQGPGLGDRDGLRQGVPVDEEDRLGGALRAAAHEGHRLGDRGGLVEERRAGDGEAGEVADDGLEVDEGLEPALGDLRLVRRVGGVPGGVLQDVALDHRRGHRAVVAEADHRAHQRVEAGQPTQLADHGALRRCGVEAQGPVRTDGAGYGDVDEGVEGGLADHLEHRRHVVRGRADVAFDERRRTAGVDVDGDVRGGVLAHVRTVDRGGVDRGGCRGGLGHVDGSWRFPAVTAR